MYGKYHTPETLALMSVAQSGANNAIYGITPINAMTIDIYDLDNVLVRSFTSQVAAANGLKIPRTTFQRYLSSGKVWNNQYTFRKSSSPSGSNPL
jgi:hypothetical protein